MGINTKDIISAAVSHLKEPSMERAEEATRKLKPAKRKAV